MNVLTVNVVHQLYVHSTEMSELRSCAKVEADVMGSPSLIVLMVSACGHKDIKQH